MRKVFAWIVLALAAAAVLYAGLSVATGSFDLNWG